MNSSAWVVALVLAGGFGGHLTEGDERNRVVMPLQKIDIPFDHAKHVNEAGLDCTDCHEDVRGSKKPADFNIPPRGLCLDCHDSEEIPWRWGRSKKVRPADRAIVMPPAHLHFSHAKHLALDGVECTTCHPGVAETALATREHLPSMETCLSCHDGERAPDTCTTCHLRGRGGTIRTALPSGELVPDDHGPRWLEQHEVLAEADLAYCASCHSQEDCVACHDGAIPPSFHDGNYLAQHPRDAMANSPPCASCHRMDTFCRDCHARAGVLVGVRLQPFGQTFHPPGWSDFPPSRPDHHSYVARKNINTCFACHEGNTCTTCHSWYQGAPTTHPPGWATSTLMRRLRRDNVNVCLQCHDPTNGSDPFAMP